MQYLIHRLHSAVGENLTDTGVEVFEDALGFAQRVGHHDRHFTLFLIGAPPVVDLLHHLLLRLPAEHRQPEGALGDKDSAFYGLKRRGDAIALGLVVARRDPHFPLVLHPYLRRADDMSGRVKGKLHPVDRARFAVGDALDPGIVAQPVLDHRPGLVGAEVVFAPPTRMIGVSVGDERSFHGLPGVDIDIGLRAVDPFGGEFEEGHWEGSCRLND